MGVGFRASGLGFRVEGFVHMEMELQPSVKLHPIGSQRQLDCREELSKLRQLACPGWTMGSTAPGLCTRLGHVWEANFSVF